MTDRNDLKLHETARADLKDNARFDGNLEDANKFLKLFGKHVSDCRLKVLLEIAVEWDSDATNPKIPTKMLKAFEGNKVNKKQIKRHR